MKQEKTFGSYKEKIKDSLTHPRPEPQQLYESDLSEVLNADRDIYQARLAQQKFITVTGDLEETENLQINTAQSLDRFQ